MAQDSKSPSSATAGGYSACQWEYDRVSDSWDTECGEKFWFTSEGPDENGFEHCPYCGGKLEVAHAE